MRTDYDVWKSGDPGERAAPFKRCLLCGVAAVLMASMGCVDLLWNGGSGPVELEAGELTTLDVAISANPGLGIGGVFLYFSDSDPAIRLIEWRWNPDLTTDDSGPFYVSIDELPDGIQTAYTLFTCEPPLDFCVPTPLGEMVHIGELDVQVDEPGSYILNAGVGRAQFVYPGGGGFIDFGDGLSLRLDVVPASP